MSDAQALWWVTDREDRLYVSSCPQLASGFMIDTGYWLQFPVNMRLDDTEHAALHRGWDGNLAATLPLVDAAKTLAARRFLGRGIN